MSSNRIISRTLPLLSLAVLTIFICMTRYADYDLWWHLRLGETIFTTGSLPLFDSFSYTASGRAQFAGEWLADLIIFLTFKAGGFAGLNLLKAVLLVITAIFLYKQIQRDSAGSRDVFVAVIISLLLALFAVRFRLFVRPYLFSLPFLSFFLYLINRWRSGVNDKLIFLLPLAMIIWANMSVGAVFGLFVTGVAAVIELFERKSFKLIPVLLLCIAASLANPETYSLYTLALDLTSDPYRTLIGEYQPITTDMLFGTGLRYTLCFQILAIGGIIYLLLCRGWKNIFQLIIFSFLLYESFRQIRLVELFSVVAVPCFALFLTRGLSVLPELPGRFRGASYLLLSVLILLLIPWTVFNSAVYAFGVGPKEGAFPEKALRFLDEQKITGKMFNSYGFGGYAIWRSKERPVFIDGRYRRLYTPAEYGEYKGILDSAESWKAAEEKYMFDYALLEYDLMSRRFPAHILKNPEWALVYWDNHSLVYLKRSPERAAIIKRFEYKVSRPTFLDLSYLDEYTKNGGVNEALTILDREVALNPDNQFVLLSRVYLRYQLGKLYLSQIQSDLERTLTMKPDFSMKHSALAMLLAASGAKERAKSEVEKALKLNPVDETAITLARELGVKVTIPKGLIPGHP